MTCCPYNLKEKAMGIQEIKEKKLTLHILTQK